MRVPRLRLPGPGTLQRALPRAGLALPLAAGLGALAFAQAAAGTGLRLPLFAPLGTAFYAWEEDGVGKAEQERGRQMREPLASGPLREAALVAAADGDLPAARRRMTAAGQMTRRDPAVQIWLADDALRANDIPAVLTHYDALLRSHAALRPPLFAKLASGLSLDAVQSALPPYAAADNPWFPTFLVAASAQGQAVAAASLLGRMDVLPDRIVWREAYGALVSALAAEGRVEALGGLYARLPGGGGSRRLTDPAPTIAAGAAGYGPFRWTLAAGPDRSAALVRDGGGAAFWIEAEPLSSGIAASRLLLPPPGAVLAWTADRTAAESDGAARWSIRCQDGDREVRSAPLGVGEGTLAVPSPCPLAVISLVVSGGTYARTQLRVGGLRWLPAPAESPRDQEGRRHAR